MTSDNAATPLAEDAWIRVDNLVTHLYPDEQENVTHEIRELVRRYGTHASERATVDERSAFLIAYGDQVTTDREVPLATLHRFAESYGRNLSAVHILPFFPYTSDDGFSVVDYLEVRQDLGTWDDVGRIAQSKDLMIDAVLNHCSRSSTWFQGFLNGAPGFERVALEMDPDIDLSMVTRPRTSPLLTKFTKASGQDTWVWTTFSDDQIDINYADPDTLVRILQVVLEYAKRGGSFLRIDAATYMWKELGTSCASLPNTHRLVQLLRAVLDLTFPRTTVITETNVPHEENISYLGRDEAQLVYNFTLPPLVFHTIATGDAKALSRWARSLELPEGTTFFNFLASHDGVGVRGVEGLLEPVQIQALADQVLSHGGRVSMRSVEGRQEPYELNISYIDALTDPAESDEVRTQRMRLAHAIAFTMRGVPAVYLHSLVGSRSAPHLVEETGAARSINREQLDMDTVERELTDPSSLRAMVYHSLDALLAARTSSGAFHPLGTQEILDAGSALFAVRRVHEGETALCIHNVTGQTQTLPDELQDMATGAAMLYATSDSVELEPYGIRWFDFPQ